MAESRVFGYRHEEGDGDVSTEIAVHKISEADPSQIFCQAEMVNW